ncbi:MAG: NupC/NupG family nucleoside CNT transporter [Parvibaculales bacterium]
MALIVQSLLGLVVFVGLAWLLSENRKRFNWKLPVALISVQFVFALIILNTPITERFFYGVNAGVDALQKATEFGTSFVFGYLGGGDLPFIQAEGSDAYVFAFRALPLIIFVSALSALLFYLGVLPRIIQLFGRLIRHMSGIDKAAALGSAANIFIGMVESPLLVRPYLKSMSRSSLFVIMTTGMCTVAGTVFALYVAILDGVVPNVAGHVIISSVLSAFAGVLVALIMVPPEEEAPPADGNIDFVSYDSAMDAMTAGTAQGLQIFLNVLASLIVALALVHLANSLISAIAEPFGVTLSLEMMAGWVMAPLMWLAGMNWAEAQIAGSLMGVKTIFNELLAFIQLTQLPEQVLSPRARIVTLYCLNGFANFSSLGIMMTGLIAVVPERRKDLLQLGPRTLISGTLATLITGAIVNLVIWDMPNG